MRYLWFRHLLSRPNAHAAAVIPHRFAVSRSSTARPRRPTNRSKSASCIRWLTNVIAAWPSRRPLRAKSGRIAVIGLSLPLHLASEPAVAPFACIANCVAGGQFASLFRTIVPIGTVFGSEYRPMPQSPRTAFLDAKFAYSDGPPNCRQLVRTCARPFQQLTRERSICDTT